MKSISLRKYLLKQRVKTERKRRKEGSSKKILTSGMQRTGAKIKIKLNRLNLA
jgi:hypothetical protein